MAMRRSGTFKRSSSESDLSEAHKRRASFIYPDGRANRPSNEGMRPASAAASRGGVVTCKALQTAMVAPPDSMWWMEQARRSLEQEIVMEGTEVEGMLHVPAVQVASCKQQYGTLPMDSAPPEKHIQAALSAAEPSSATEDRLLETAVCLATPDTFEEEPETEIRTVQARNSQTAGIKTAAPSLRQDTNSSSINTVLRASSRLEIHCAAAASARMLAAATSPQADCRASRESHAELCNNIVQCV